MKKRLLHSFLKRCGGTRQGYAHHGRGGCGLVHLVLGSLDLSLQVGRRVEVLALFPGAAALDVVHAHGDGVVVGVDHGAVCGVSEAALVLGPCAAAPLILPTHLEISHFKPDLRIYSVDKQLKDM